MHFIKDLNRVRQSILHSHDRLDISRLYRSTTMTRVVFCCHDHLVVRGLSNILAIPRNVGFLCHIRCCAEPDHVSRVPSRNRLSHRLTHRLIGAAESWRRLVADMTASYSSALLYLNFVPKFTVLFYMVFFLLHNLFYWLYRYVTTEIHVRHLNL
jgi:hypothetical protein